MAPLVESPTSPESPAYGTPGAPSFVSSRRRGLLPLVMCGIAIYALVIGIERLRSNAYCENPLAVWLIVHSCLTLTQGVLLFTRSHARLAPSPTLFRLSLLASLVLFVATMAWLVVGGVWVWSISSSSCDSTVYKSTQSVVVLGIVITAIVILSLSYQARKRWVDHSKRCRLHWTSSERCCTGRKSPTGGVTAPRGPCTVDCASY